VTTSCSYGVWHAEQKWPFPYTLPYLRVCLCFENAVCFLWATRSAGFAIKLLFFPVVILSSEKIRNTQCKYNVTLWRVRVTNVAVEMHNVFYICVCILSYRSCKAHAPYYIVICGPSHCTHIFPHYLVTDTIFGKKLLNIKSVFWFCPSAFVWKTSH
jgi:hypothetical protein